MKILIFCDEFMYDYVYNLIEYVKSCLKLLDSIVEKFVWKGIDELDFDCICVDIIDIVGVWVICSFVVDVYWLFDLFMV